MEEITVQQGIPQKINVQSPSDPFRWEYSHFNIYNQEELIGTAPAGTLEFTDESFLIYNAYTVTTAWESYESAPSNEVIISYVGLSEHENSPHEIIIGPNPASDQVFVKFKLQEPGTTTINILDLKGKQVYTLFEGKLEAGKQSMVFEPDQTVIKAGVYFIAINHNGKIATRKLIFW